MMLLHFSYIDILGNMSASSDTIENLNWVRDDLTSQYAAAVPLSCLISIIGTEIYYANWNSAQKIE